MARSKILLVGHLRFLELVVVIVLGFFDTKGLVVIDPHPSPQVSAPGPEASVRPCGGIVVVGFSMGIFSGIPFLTSGIVIEEA